MIISALFAAATFGVHPQIVAALPRVPLPRAAASLPRAATHGNHTPAGTQTGRTLTLALDVVSGAWKPEGDDDPEVPVLLFAEHGKSPTVPGPMIRVVQGTNVRLTLTNASDSAIVVRGLRPRLADHRGAEDSVMLAPRASRELSYRFDSSGTFFYFGALRGNTFDDRLWIDSQLNGAIVVEPPGQPSRPNEQVFVFSEWFHPYDDPNRAFEVVSVINGKAWPHTERLTLPLGDSVRFRVLNAMPLAHPIHLHGFYYRIVSRGTWQKDGPIRRALQPMMNTDVIAPGGTMAFDFVPTTPGNWLMHCHFSFHMDETVTLAGSPRDSAEAAMLTSRPPSDPMGHLAHETSAASERSITGVPTGTTAGPATASAGSSMSHRSGEHHMRGLVVGFTVPSPPGRAAYDGAGARDLRLLVQRKAGRLINGYSAFGFALQSGSTEPARDSVALPGPVLELQRGKPVRITVVNNLEEPTGIHWHGLEIESFPDGVPNWSGSGDHLFKPIAPRDSFVAAFTPPRAGTFPYHSHLNERAQITSGMYGALIVTESPRDLERDHLIVAGGGGPAVFAKIESPYALVNGRRSPAPLRLTAGKTHRLRIVSVHPDWRIAFTLRNDRTLATWRAIAKDGYDMPPAQATVRPAHVEMGPGETADFEFRAMAPGRWLLEVRSTDTGWFIPMEVIVESGKAAR